MDQRNLLLAIVLSVTILLGWQLFFEVPRMEEERARQAQEQVGGAGAPVPSAADMPAAQGAPPGSAPVAGSPEHSPEERRASAIAGNPRIRIETDRLSGSIRLKGAMIDDLTLIGYKQTVSKDSPEIVLLSPDDTESAYFARFGWVTQTPDVSVPTAETVWTASRSTLTSQSPVTLTWTSPEGVEFIQVISVDEDYMFNVVQRVRNTGNGTISLGAYGLVSLTGTPETSGFFILHEGPVGVFDNQLKEVDYDDVADDRKIEQSSTGGWIGITYKYFATALIPDQSARTNSRWVHTAPERIDKYQADFLSSTMTVGAGQTLEFPARLFAGAKEVLLLDKYEETLGIPRFDRLVDFGWFYFLTKPIFYVIEYFYRLLGNFGLAILLLTVLIKLAFFPLANKSYRSMSRMKKLQPQMMELREKHKDDRQAQSQAMMALYKAEGANPMSGCFPILIQIPVFFALYKVLFVTIEMRHAPFFGWIQDLSAPDPLGLLTAFGLIPWNVPQELLIVNIGIWPIIMGLTMYLQQKLNPQPADPMQAKIFMLLPIVFTFLLGSFPAGLVIYWAWNNLLSIAQQWVIMRQMGVSVSGESTKTAAPTPPPRGAKKQKAGGEKAKATGGNAGEAGEQERETGEANSEEPEASASKPVRPPSKARNKSRSRRKRR